MSQASHEEIVRRAFDSFQRLDLDGFTAEWAPDVVWDVSGYDDWPGEKTVYRGTAEVLDGFAHYLAGIKGFQTSGHEVIPVDHQRVIGLHNEHRTNEEDRPVLLEIGVVYLFIDDEVVRADVYTGHTRARRVVGLL
jgi:ketosteroid isomerase-like protein